MPEAVSLVESPIIPNVYETLAAHQKTEKWDMRELIIELQRLAEIFTLEFKLEIPEISLSIDWLRYHALGHFREGHNGFGLRGEVVINRRHLYRHFWQIHGTLLHELLHAWQQEHGRPGRRNYHNKEFRKKAYEFGLIIDEKGHTQYESDSPFFKVLQKYGINVVNMPPIEEIQEKQRGFSKLKKWSCGCQNARVAIPDFQARCLKCGNIFKVQEP